MKTAKRISLLWLLDMLSIRQKVLQSYDQHSQVLQRLLPPSCQTPELLDATQLHIPIISDSSPHLRNIHPTPHPLTSHPNIPPIQHNPISFPLQLDNDNRHFNCTTPKELVLLLALFYFTINNEQCFHTLVCKLHNSDCYKFCLVIQIQ